MEIEVANLYPPPGPRGDANLSSLVPQSHTDLRERQSQTATQTVEGRVSFVSFRFYSASRFFFS